MRKLILEISIKRNTWLLERLKVQLYLDKEYISEYDANRLKDQIKQVSALVNQQLTELCFMLHYR